MLKKIIKYIILSAIFGLITIFSINIYVVNTWVKYVTNLKELKEYKVWIVFWASVRNNSEPSDILKDRLNVALYAYKAGKIKNIIVSWDNSLLSYNEPQVMANYLLKHWVKEENIYKDHAGFDTYDSLYRAKEVFWVSELVLFTQEFHLIRWLYISNRLWIKSVGVSTDLQEYKYINNYKNREIAARVKAFLEIEILKAESKFLWDKIEIK